MTAMRLGKSWEHEVRNSYKHVISESVVSDVIRLLNETIISEIAAQEDPHRPSIMELQGLGRELWKGIDAESYINELRDEWDHR